MGLSFYEEADAELFFGRDHERKVIIGNLRASRLTLLYAQSGVGKSSLLRAGVASRLRELAHRGLEERGSPRYVPVVFSSWKDDPVSELIEEIGRSIAPFTRGDFPPDLPTESLEDAVAAAASAIDATLLIVLDQFEEYFLYRSRESRDVHFADQLATCVNRGDLRANFLIAIREDAYAGLGDLFKGRVANVYGNYLHLENLGQDTAREAIERPIARYNEINPGAPVEIEAALVDAVLKGLEPANFVSEQAGKGTIDGVNGGGPKRDEIAAPYLQLVMKRLWETEMAAGSHVLHASTLQALGGTKMIVRTHLDRALGDLSPEDRDIAVDLFHQLVTPSGTKIAHTVADLADYSSQSEAQVETLLERLAGGEARILRPVPSPSGEDGRRFEISHDLLAPAILDWRSRQAAVRLEREKHLAEHRAQRERNRARRFRALAVGSLVLLGVAVYLALVAISDNQIAQSRQLAAIAKVALRSDPEAGTLLALQAVRKHHTQEAEAALRDALPQLQLLATLRSAPPVRSAAYSPDGTRIVTAAADGTAQIWEASSGRRVRALTGSLALNSAVFSPDGRRVLGAGDDGTAHIWDVGSGRQLAVLSDPGGLALTNATFSPDGRLIATIGASGRTAIWEASSGKRRLVIEEPDRRILLGVAFSPDSKRIATTGAAGVARLWSVDTGAAVGHPMRARFPLYSVAFSPDGKKIITAGGDDVARIWDAASQTPRGVLSEPPGYVLLSAAFSPDGREIVTASSDATARLWDAHTDKPLRVLSNPAHAGLLGASFSPDSHEIVTAGADGRAHIWDTNGREHAGSPLREPGSNRLQSVAVSANGRLLATGSHSATATVWDARTHKPVVVISQPEGDAINAIAFVDGDAFVVTATQSGRLFFWGARTGVLQAELNQAVGHPLNSVAVDPRDSRMIATGGDDGVARVWDLSRLVQVASLAPEASSPMRSVAFSPSGEQIVTGSVDGLAHAWNRRTRKLSRAFGFSGYGINSVAFSNDGHQIMTAGNDGTAYVWDSKTHKESSGVTEPGSAVLRDAVFSPDSQSVLTASTDGTARLWEPNTQVQQLSFAGHAGPINSVAFTPDSRYVVTASSDGTTRIWRALPREQQGFALAAPSGASTGTAAFDPLGRPIVATANSDGTIDIWNSSTHARRVPQLHQPSGQGGSSTAEFSQDGKWLITTGGDATARIWSTSTYKDPRVLRDDAKHPICSNQNNPSAIHLNAANFNRDASLAVTASADGTGCIWNTRTGRPIGAVFEPTGSTTGVAGISGSGLRWAVFSGDSRRILTASDDGTARIWDVKSRSQVAVLSEPGGEALNDAWFSPDGKSVLTASNDGTSRIWDASSGQQRRVLTEPGHTQVFNAAFSPDGRLVVTCAGTARIWNAKSGRQLTAFQYGNTLSDCEFSPDGRLIVTAGTDGGTRIFTTELAGNLSAIENLANQRVTRHTLTAEENSAYLAGS